MKFIDISIDGAKKNDKGKPVQEEVKKSAKYEMPGQKHATPEQGDGTRQFYESLYKSKPTSRMAMQWLLEQGCLDSNQKAMEVQKKLGVK